MQAFFPCADCGNFSLFTKTFSHGSNGATSPPQPTPFDSLSFFSSGFAVSINRCLSAWQLRHSSVFCSAVGGSILGAMVSLTVGMALTDPHAERANKSTNIIEMNLVFNKSGLENRVIFHK